jgi:hypothetical protein
VDAQNAQIWTTSVVIGIEPKSAQNGGSARCYQAIFVPSTALASPGYDGQPAVYLYIAALEVTSSIAADRVFLDCRGAGILVRRAHRTGPVTSTVKLGAGHGAG